MVLSLLSLTSVLPSGLKATLLTFPVCPLSVCLCAPVTASHSRIVLLSPPATSAFPLASVLPSGLKATLVDHTLMCHPVCTLIDRFCACQCERIPEPDGRRPRLPIASRPAIRAEGYAIDLPRVPFSVRVCFCAPVTASHRRMVLSQFTASERPVHPD